MPLCTVIFQEISVGTSFTLTFSVFLHLQWLNLSCVQQPFCRGTFPPDCRYYYCYYCQWESKVFQWFLLLVCSVSLMKNTQLIIQVPHYSATIFFRWSLSQHTFSRKSLVEHTTALAIKLSMLYSLGFLHQLVFPIFSLNVYWYIWKTIKIISSKN